MLRLAKYPLNVFSFSNLNNKQGRVWHFAKHSTNFFGCKNSHKIIWDNNIFLKKLCSTIRFISNAEVLLILF